MIVPELMSETDQRHYSIMSGAIYDTVCVVICRPTHRLKQECTYCEPVSTQWQFSDWKQNL